MSNVTGSISAAAQISSDAWAAQQEKYLEDYYKPRDQWQAALSVLVGIYSLVKQHQIMKEYLALAKEQVAQAERYLTLAESHYNTIAVPTYQCQKKLFDRYFTEFAKYETEFLLDAFRLKEYTPEYELQQGRAVGVVTTMFDKARKQRRRQTGKYATGRACHDATYFTTMQALAKVDAVNNAYRFEESRKFRLDQWYWQRRTAGVGIVDGMANRVVSGLNAGAQVANQGLSAVGQANANLQNAFQFVENGYTNMANFWGSVANSAFSFAGYQYGRSQAQPFGGGGMGTGMQSSVPQYGAQSMGAGMSAGVPGVGPEGYGQHPAVHNYPIPAVRPEYNAYAAENVGP